MAFNAGAVRGSLELNTQEFVASLRRASLALDRIERNTEQAARGQARFRAAIAGIIAVAGAATTAFFALRGAVRGLSAAVQTSAAFEQLEIRLRTLLGSQEEANTAIENFIQLSARTPFSVQQIVEGAATLSSAALGNREQLELLTKTAANLAAVTGLSFQEAASNLQRALSGGIGAADLFRERGVRALIESIQGIPDLTKVPLAELEKAFVDTFGPNGTLGTSAADLSNTLGGALSNVDDAFINLKDAIGDALSPTVISAARDVIIPALESLRDVVRENQGTLTELAGGGLRLAAIAAINFAQAGLALLEVFSKLGRAIAAVRLGIAELELRLATTSAAAQRLLGFDTSSSVRSVKELSAEVGRLKTEFIESSKDNARLAATLRGLDKVLSDVETQFRKSAGAAGEAARAQDGLNNSTNRGIVAESAYSKALGQRLAKLREITGVSFKSAEAAGDIAAGAAAAAENTERLAAAARDASGSFASAASSAAATADATAGASRRSGGSLGLVGQTSAQTAGNLSALQQNLSRVGGIFGRAQRQSGRAVVNQLAGQLRGQIAEETRQFTASLIDELARQGITDPTERQAFIQQRLDEARRLGVITRPPTSIGFVRGGSIG